MVRDNIKTDLGETGLGSTDVIDMTQDRDLWRTLVNTVMNLRFPQKLLTSSASDWQLLKKDSATGNHSCCVCGCVCIYIYIYIYAVP
jgi:hypothetical protein